MASTYLSNILVGLLVLKLIACIGLLVSLWDLHKELVSIGKSREEGR